MFERLQDLLQNKYPYVKLIIKGMKNLRNESIAAEFLGNAFVLFPRSVFKLLFIYDKSGQSAGILYTALLSKVFFKQGYTTVKKVVYTCNPGEYIARHQDLAAYCGMGERTYYGALKWLVDKKLVGTTTLQGATRFYLYGYVEFGKTMKLTTASSGATAGSSASLEEAERRMGGRSIQFDCQDGQESGKGEV